MEPHTSGARRLRAAFMGSPDFAVPSLEATARVCDVPLVISQPDRRAGRGRKLVAPPVKVAAERLGLPVAQPRKLRTGKVAATLRALELDLIVVAAYGRILPRSILEAPRHGCVNVHASLLPRWRGASPIQRAVLAGDAETGVAIMRMEQGLDTGPVYRIARTAIEPHETSGELFERLATLGGECLEGFLREFPNVPLPTPQAEDGVTYAELLEKQHGRVDWSRDAGALVDHVRGMDPWPGAFTVRDGATLKLFTARRSAHARPEGARPGEVLAADQDGLHVACGEGVLCVAYVQPPGKRRMLARDYVAGRPFADGERLGDA